jgi:hypothetical protein
MKALIIQILMLGLGIFWAVLSMNADTVELQHFRLLTSSIWITGSLIVGARS